jgi:hypothetical protein
MGPGPGGPGSGFGPGGPLGGPGPMGGMSGGAKSTAHLNVFSLKNAKAEEMVAVLSKLFPSAEMVADPRTNTVVARADEKTLEELKMLITRLDAQDSFKQK